MHAMIYKCQVVSDDYVSCMEYWSCPGEQVQMKSGINRLCLHARILEIRGRSTDPQFRFSSTKINMALTICTTWKK